MINLVIDVDFTVVDTDLALIKYLQTEYTKRYGHPKHFIVEEENMEYNLGKYFPELGQKFFLDFWSQSDLYDNLVPKTYCKEVLQKLHDTGDYNIMFASYCKKGHFGSKYDFLKKHFPYMRAFFATKEKEFLKADIFIDDRHDMLNARIKEDPWCTRIKMNTPYNQLDKKGNHIELIEQGFMHTVNNWKEIGEIFSDDL